MREEEETHCTDCVELAEEWKRMERNAVLRQIALDLEMCIKWLALKYVSNEMSERLKDIEDNITEGTLQDAYLHEMERSFTLENFQRFCREDLALEDEDQHDELVEDLEMLKDEFGFSSNPKMFEGNLVDNFIRHKLLSETNIPLCNKALLHKCVDNFLAKH